MASLKKIQKNFVGNLFKHNNRSKGDGTIRTNETIDEELTPLNYYFKKGKPEDIHKVIEDNGYFYMNRANSNPIVEAVVTLPENVKEEDEEAFFASVYNFYCNDFGEVNVVNAVVHKDEVTPHLHLDFIPVRNLDKGSASRNFRELIKAEEKRLGKEITKGVSSKAVITRDYLKTMHPRLSEWVEKDLGYRTDILNGKTANGNRTVLMLKNEFYEHKLEELKKEVSEKENQAETVNKNIQIITNKTKELGLDDRYFDASAMLDEQMRLMAERDIYKQALRENGITNIRIPAELREKLKKYNPNDLDNAMKNGNKFRYKSGLMVPESGTVTVIETFIEKPRPLPQQYLIDGSPTLSFMCNTMKPREIKVVNAENDYLLFPTDDYERTFRNLRKLKEREKEFSKINIPKISNDTFNIAEMVLRQCSFETNYYYMEQLHMENAVLDRDIHMGMDEVDDE